MAHCEKSGLGQCLKKSAGRRFACADGCGLNEENARLRMGGLAVLGSGLASPLLLPVS